MKKSLLVVVLVAVSIIAISGLSTLSSGTEYEDGTYRGVFIDRGGIEVVVQFSLENNIVTNVSYRLLGYGGQDYLDPQSDFVEALGEQYQQVIEHLVDKDIEQHIADLYQPGDFVEDVDTFSGATIRANKIRSAIQDGLNRGVYSY